MPNLSESFLAPFKFTAHSLACAGWVQAGLSPICSEKVPLSFSLGMELWW